MTKQLSKWNTLKYGEDEYVSFRENIDGLRVIEIRKEFDNIAQAIRYTVIWYRTTGDNYWGGFVSDFVYDEELANICADYWIKKNGYEYND